MSIKIGIIGTGSIAQTHMDAYKKMENVELYALCDINEERVRASGERYGVERIYTSVEEMLAACPELDAVSVCTWNSAHAPCTIAALNAGKHVLCEKPMATNAEEARKMREAAEKNGKLLMIGFVRRFGNDCKILEDFIEKDTLGEIYYAKATYLRRNGSPGGWFGDKSRSAGGPLIDLGVHVIDLVRYLVGNPRPISVYGATFKKLANRPGIKNTGDWVSSEKSENDIFDVEDMATAMIRFDNGVVLSIEASFSLNIKKDEGKIELFGTKAGVKIDPEMEFYSEINGFMSNYTLEAETALSFGGLFENEIRHFVECVDGEAVCKAPAEDGIALMEILDAIYKSAETGHEVII